MPHRFTSLAEVQHALRLSGTSLFNTALSYRRLLKEPKTKDAKISFSECIPTYDPTEYSVSINIEASDNSAGITLDYWTDYISDGHAANVGSTFLKSLQNVIHHSDEMVQNLDHFSKSNGEQVFKWNSRIPDAVDDCVHRIIEEQSRLYPVAPAVCAWDAEFTYSELEDLTTRLAVYLTG